MKKDELHPKLQPLYDITKTHGTEKGLVTPYENTWFVIPLAPPQESPQIDRISTLAEANKILQALPRLESLSAVDRLVLGLLVKREALASSRMEGTWSTIDHVLTPGEVYDKKEKSGRSSILGYAHALEDVFEKAVTTGLPFLNSNLVQDLHRKIMSEDPDFQGVPGQLRSEETPPRYVTIGGFPRVENSTYNPTPPQYVNQKLQEVLEWMKNDVLVEMGNAGMGMGLLVRMAIAHAHFEAVHPFRDGNGRVGRMLMVLQMICEGYSPLYLSNYIELKKNQYGESLAQAQKKLNYGPLIEFFSEAVTTCWHESGLTKESLLSLPNTWRARAQFRKYSTAERMLENLLAQPIFTVKSIMTTLAVSSPAANNAAEQLVKSHIVRERTGFGRNRVFAAEEVISLLSRPMAEPTEDALLRARAIL